MTTAAPSARPPAPAEALLDATGRLLDGRRWAEVRMSDVAAGAGTSRQTLYNTFGTREGLARAYVGREASRFLSAVEETITANAADPAGALAAAVELFLSAAGSHPLVRAIAASEEGDELLTLVTTRGGPVLGPVTDRLAEVIVATWPQADPAAAALAADTLVRLAVSHAALPGGSPAEVAAGIGRIAGPFIERELSV